MGKCVLHTQLLENLKIFQKSLSCYKVKNSQKNCHLSMHKRLTVTSLVALMFHWSPGGVKMV